MAEYLIVHSGRCVKKLLRVFKEFLRGKHSLLEFIRQSLSCVSDCWYDYKAPPLTDHRKDSMDLVNDGVKLYNAKKYNEALKAFRTATEYDSTYARAYVYLGNTLYKLADHSEALRMWQHAIALDPLSDAAGKARVKVERVKSQNEMAIRDLHEGLKK